MGLGESRRSHGARSAFGHSNKIRNMLHQVRVGATATRQLHDFPPLPARRAVQGSLAWDLGIARSTGGSVFLCEPRVPLDAAGVHVLRRSPTSLCEALTREEFKCLEMEDNKTISCIVVATFTPSLSSYQSSSRYFWSPSFLAQRLRLGRSDFYDALLLTRVVTGYLADEATATSSRPLTRCTG